MSRKDTIDGPLAAKLGGLPSPVEAEVRRLVNEALENLVEKRRRINREAQTRAREGRKSLTLLMPEQVHRDFKAACAAQEVTMTTVLLRLMDRYIDECGPVDKAEEGD